MTGRTGRLIAAVAITGTVAVEAAAQTQLGLRGLEHGGVLPGGNGRGRDFVPQSRGGRGGAATKTRLHRCTGPLGPTVIRP